MSSLNGKAPPDPLDEVRASIETLEGRTWHEESPAVHVHVGDTGRFQAVEADTVPMHPMPSRSAQAPASDPPGRRGLFGFLLAVLNTIQPPWLRGVVVIVALGLLAWRGGALAGLWK